MYSGGERYFDIILPLLGPKASYFALRSPWWNFFGLDTAYVAGCFHSPAEKPARCPVDTAAKTDGRDAGTDGKIDQQIVKELHAWIMPLIG